MIDKTINEPSSFPTEKSDVNPQPPRKPKPPTKQGGVKRLVFRTRFVYVLTLLVCVWVLAYSLNWIDYMAPLLAVLAINMIGVVAAVIVTQVLRFPRDGGYRDPEIRAEFGQDEH
ncbi:MAG: hypothetical protein ACI814_004119 [Mariniblastus sp.]|jgi:hypothetical protein